MKNYKLIRELPMFKAGDGGFYLDSDGNLAHCASNAGEAVYPAPVLARHPEILQDWFEETKENPETVYGLEYGDKCWMRDVNLQPLQIEWRGTPYDNQLRDLGLIFLSKEDLENDNTWQRAKQILLRDTKGFKPNWKDENQKKWFVRYNHIANEFAIVWDDVNQYSEVIYYRSETDAKASLIKHCLEYLTLFGVEE